MEARWQMLAAVRLLRARGQARAAMAVADLARSPEDACVLARLALGVTRYELECRGYDIRSSYQNWLDLAHWYSWKAEYAAAIREAERMWLQLDGYYAPLRAAR